MDKKKVKDYMTYDVVSVDISGTAKDVIDKIHKTHHDGFPVIDNNGVVGYISARDLLFVQPTTPVEQVMSKNLIVADPEMDINDAARVIFRSGIQKLPVVDEKNHLLGIISNSDVIRSQIEHVSPEKVFNFITTLKKLYNVDPTLDRGTVPIRDLLPTQSKIYEDELEGTDLRDQKRARRADHCRQAARADDPCRRPSPGSCRKEAWHHGARRLHHRDQGRYRARDGADRPCNESQNP